MVFPAQRPPNFHPNQMQRMPQNSMFPHRGFNAPSRGNNIQNMLQRFLPTQGFQQGALPTRAVGGLSSTLNNVQQVLKVVQSTAPIVQQYGPMVKNLPAMYRMMKAFKEVDDDEGDVEKVEDESIGIESKNKNEQTIQVKENTKNSNRSNQGVSKPKLYI